MQKITPPKKVHHAALAMLFCASSVYAAPDEISMGRNSNYSFPSNASLWSWDDRYLVGEFSHMDEILPSRKINTGSATMPLTKATDIPPITYTFAGKTSTLDDYLNRNRTTGLLIIQDNKIIFERYQYDRKPEHHFSSFSMSKSITATLIGIALLDGKIKSLDDAAIQYVPGLKGSVYAGVTIRNLLQMSSGVQWNQSFGHGSGSSDNAIINKNTLLQANKGGVNAIDHVKARSSEQGTQFQYKSGDTFVLGLILEAALVGESVAEYTSRKLWVPLGAEDSASWIVDAAGTAIAHDGYAARLRDYGRLGMLWANDGKLNGKQIVDKEYMLEATSIERQPARLQPFGQVDQGTGYGYQFWLNKFKRRTFTAAGAYGQSIQVQAESKIVIVETSALAHPDHAPTDERIYMVNAIYKALGGFTERMKSEAK